MSARHLVSLLVRLAVVLQIKNARAQNKHDSKQYGEGAVRLGSAFCAFMGKTANLEWTAGKKSPFVPMWKRVDIRFQKQEWVLCERFTTEMGFC